MNNSTTTTTFFFFFFFFLMLNSEPLEATRPREKERTFSNSLYKGAVPPPAHSHCSRSSREGGECPIKHKSIKHVSIASPRISGINIHRRQLGVPHE
ncbi:hypothetical protein AAC387_Pa08g1783 [Persea americana]